jgi:hypothetical protein
VANTGYLRISFVTVYVYRPVSVFVLEEYETFYDKDLTSVFIQLAEKRAVLYSAYAKTF